MNNPFDFWYAVKQTRVVVMPVRRLETFGNTILSYHMISELMDTVGQVRIREGRIQAYRPQIITPDGYATELLEGFGEEAQRYAEWLREHSQELRILKYGFKIRKEEVNQHTVSDNLATVVERVEQAVRAKDDPLTAVITGIDDPWEVSLLKLMADMFGHSLPGNVREMERHNLFASPETGIRQAIDADFAAAGNDREKLKALGAKLQKLGLFSEYEDRFFDLMKQC